MPTTSTQSKNQGTLAQLRGLVPNRAVTEREALQIAELQAARFRRHLGIEEALFPTEALDLPRIRIEFDADLPSSGMAFWSGSSWVIVLNPTESRTRQRFTLLHEFKHIVDHTTKDRLYGADSLRDAPAAERAADYFAACVLMPKMYVKRHWGCGPRSITSMAKLFNVSPAAMRFRLDQLGLIDNPGRCHWDRSTYRRRSPRKLEFAA